eukprot:PhM_4_TR8189/c0_g1_i1/m.81782
MDIETKKSRVKNALWGLFVADALSMPVHWYYNRDNILKDFGPKGVTTFEAPRASHPESFLAGAPYSPDVETATRLGRKYDFLHGNRTFFSGSYMPPKTEEQIAAEQARAARGEKPHYHEGLKAGENTLNAELVRLLLNTCVVAGNGSYDETAFMAAFVDFFTTPGRNTDCYSEVTIRLWFENYSKGGDVRNCAPHQTDVWSVGSMGGLVRPLVVSMLIAAKGGSELQAVGAALEHLNLTHRSSIVSQALVALVPLLYKLITNETVNNESNVKEMWYKASRKIHPPKITGEGIQAIEREYKGPSNIPKDVMWRIHNDLQDKPLDLDALVALHDPNEVINKQFRAACYPEHGVPLILYFGARHSFDFESSVLEDVNAGGDNVHRAAILGLLLGAAAHPGVPEHLIRGLRHHAELEKEITAFVDAIFPK